MGFRFRKSVKIAPGVKINFGKKSTGISIGNKGGGISFNSRTGARVRASVPGTGISYTSKLGGRKKRKAAAKRTAQRTDTSANLSATVTDKWLQPVSRRWWFITLAVVLIIGGIGTPPLGVLYIAGGAFMIYIRSNTDKLYFAPGSTPSQFNRQLQIFDESVKIFMETTNPDTFFGRYSDAFRAASEMNTITDAPLVHGETAGDALEALENQRGDAVTAFLNRYHDAVQAKAEALKTDRGKNNQYKRFRESLEPYFDQMTQDNINYIKTVCPDEEDSG
ncbi:MAG: DUF4236 domain-containing protein [Oscillibacter sp.]|nr:DUF4236 domain-containing protein [Oscillibacter sp.]